MKNYNYSVFLALSLVLSGCVGLAPSRLATIQNGCTVKLSEDLVYEADRGGWGTRYEFRIVQGDYKAVFADKYGIYYQGSPSCYRQKLLVAGGIKKELLGKVITVSDCGFYVPKDSSSKVSIFMITGTGADRVIGGATEAQVQQVIAAANRPGSSGMATEDSKQQGAQSIGAAVTPVVNNASLSPLSAGVGGGIAAGVATAIVQAERGRYYALPEEVEAREVRHSIESLCR